MRMVYCIKLQKDAEGLPRIPYPGDIGKRIFEQVSKEAWKSWLGHQTTLINENRLILTEPKTRIFLEEEMEKYFFGQGSLKPAGFKPTVDEKKEI